MIITLKEEENINYIFAEFFSKQDSVNGWKSLSAMFLKKKFLS